MKHAKKAFLASLLSVVLCVTMLVGTTYAWFTDSVTSAGNKIIAGNLDIDLYQHDGTSYVEITDNSAPIFGSSTSTIAQNNNADTLWEPGKTQVAYLKLQNNGSLALKYQVALKVTNPADGKNLYKAMRYKIVPDAQPGSVTSWAAAPGTANTVVPGTQIASGSNTTDTYPGVMMGPNDEHYFALVIHMMEEAGNEYQGGSVEFDLQVIATQQTDEADSFDNQYDKDAKYLPEITVTKAVLDVMPEANSLTLQENSYSVTIPGLSDEDLGSTYKLDVEDISTETVSDEVTVLFEATLYKDDVPVTTNEGKTYTLTKEIGPGQVVTVVKHNDESVTRDDYNTGAAGTYYYDTASGILYVYVSHFSPFEATYKVKTAVTTVTLNKTELSLGLGEEDTLSASVAPQDASFQVPVWSSSDESVATVDKNGKVTAVGGGTATISATVDGVVAECALTVTVTTYTVTFDTKYYNVNVASQEIMQGGKVTQPATPEKEGYLFRGWFADYEMTVPFDFANTSITEDTTIYALWRVPVGGTIYYIHEDAVGTYTFYKGISVTDCAVTNDPADYAVGQGGDLNLFVEVTGKPEGAIDKYFVYDSTNGPVYNPNSRSDGCMQAPTQFGYGGNLYKTQDITALGDGKTALWRVFDKNTGIVIPRVYNSGALVFKALDSYRGIRDDESYNDHNHNTAWALIDFINDYGNLTASDYTEKTLYKDLQKKPQYCDEWYIGTQDDLLALRAYGTIGVTISSAWASLANGGGGDMLACSTYLNNDGIRRWANTTYTKSSIETYGFAAGNMCEGIAVAIRSF